MSGAALRVRSVLVISAASLIVQICWFVQRSSAQAVYGGVHGRLTSVSGKPIHGAKITVTSEEKGTTFRASTDQAGHFVVTHLIPDTYDVQFEAPGYKRLVVSQVPVST